MQKEPIESTENKKLASDLREKNLFAIEMYNPDPKRNAEVIAILVSATAPDKRWLKWLTEKLSE